MKTVHSVLFRAPLEEYLEKGVYQFEIQQPDLEAFLTTYNDGRWVLMFTDEKERDERETREAIVKAIGRTDIPIEIITTGTWDLGARVSDSFVSGRVFFAGDSAHHFPPTRGGYGANTGIHDAHNLAWKISSVLSGTCSPQLLSTYDNERRPVAWVRHQQIFARPDYQSEAAGLVTIDPIIDDVAMELGQIYRSTAVAGATADLPVAQRPDQWNGQPGTRAAHLWVERAGERLSTLDLLQRRWVLFSEEQSWKEAAASASDQTGIEVEAVLFGPDVRPEKPEEFRSLYGLGRRGACLIRPDGYIAWRIADLPDDAAAELAKTLAQVACSLRHPSPKQVSLS